jgi:putative flippase GtrA
MGLAISSGMLFVLVEKMQTNEIVSKIITVFAVALIQFLSNKYISFRYRKCNN